MNPLVIAHRGYSLRAPENTLAAFKLGWESGADGIECDVHLSADGRVVCIHDHDTGRVSREVLTVARTKWSDLQKLDVGSWKDNRWAGESIPLLEDAIKAGPSTLLWVVEIKCGPEIVTPLIDAVHSTGHSWDRLVVISFNQNALRELKIQRPEIKTYWLSEFVEDTTGSFDPSIEKIMGTIEALNVDGFGGQSGKGITRDLSQELKSAQLELNVWTVDDPEEALRMREIGATSVTTNDPQRIVSTFERA